MIKRYYKKIVSERLRITLRSYLIKAKYPLYLGDTHYCICCDTSFRKFLTKGNVPRENAMCPRCMSLERTRVLDYYLDRELDIYGAFDGKILHIAPEECLQKKFVKKHGDNYIDGDINPALARHMVDLTDIPFEADTFNLIICSHVLGHIPDEEKAMKEMYRVLKPNGILLVLSVLNLESETTYEDDKNQSAEEKLAAYGEHDLVRLHGMDLADRIAQGGFDRVESIDYRLQFSVSDQKRFSLGNGAREIIFRAEKD